ncbi:hypothetical protein AVEN_10434-1, partial [Araneus ventricosus]
MSASELEGARFEKPIPMKIRRALSLLQAKSYVGGHMFFHWCRAEVWRRECQFRCRPHHLTAVQNYE